MANLRDAAIVVAAGATIIGTVLWLKQGEDARQLAAATGAEQQKMRVALERLAPTIKRIETQLQTLAAGRQGDAAVSASAKPATLATSKRAAVVADTASAPSTRRRKPSGPKTSRIQNANDTMVEQAVTGTASDQAAKEAE